VRAAAAALAASTTLFRWVSAEAAADLAALLGLRLRKVLAAADAARWPVLSPLRLSAMIALLRIAWRDWLALRTGFVSRAWTRGAPPRDTGEMPTRKVRARLTDSGLETESQSC
jgi:hypothetical protein